MAVSTEIKAGTMAEGEGNKTPLPEAKTPGVESKVSPEEEERPIYTQKQVASLIHAKDSEWGRKAKAVEEERDNLRKDMKTHQSRTDEIQAERDTLQEKMEELTSDDPKKFDYVKRDKQLRDLQRQLNAQKSELDGKVQALAEREKKVNSFELEVRIATIADEYEDGDEGRLKKAVSVFESPTEEQIKSIAAILFSQPSVPAEAESKPPLKPDSGRTRGGSTYFTRTQIADRKFWEANKEAILLAQKEGRIRDE